jgi:mxaJ protein
MCSLFNVPFKSRNRRKEILTRRNAHRGKSQNLLTSIPTRLRWWSVLVWLFALVAAGVDGADTNRLVLRVAADPNNLPFSNDHLEGFENRIAALIARDLDAEIQYNWRAQRRGFFRETLKENQADLVMGVPAGFERAAATKPYYTSTYVFVWKKDRGLDLKNLDDGRLKSLRIGVQVVGDDYANTPPAQALVSRGIVTNISGYTLYGNYSDPNPPAQIISAVERGEIDVALVWGPLAGFFAARAQTPLEVRPIEPTERDSDLVFSIAVGCRRKDPELKKKVETILAAHRTDIDAILDEYHVPRVAPPVRARRDD